MWQWECLVPHPPIIVPEVGQGREKEATNTVTAMENLAISLKENIPDTVLLLTPHNDFSDGIFFLVAQEYSGDLSMFGHPEVKLSLTGSTDRAEDIIQALLDGSIPVKKYMKERILLDHASIVPLYFFNKYWDHLPKLIIANPIGLSPRQALQAGKILKNSVHGPSMALIASGDLSHRLTVDAPAGFHPDGKLFDDLITESLKTNAPQKLLQADIGMLNNAGECGLRSTMVFMGCAEGRKIEILSYEGPFGVGYCVARSGDLKINNDTVKDPYTNLARFTILNYLQGKTLGEIYPQILREDLMNKPRACFISLKTRDGNLRGCIGTVEPLKDTLVNEIVENSISAATRDPRFPPVRLTELDDLVISVDILSEPEEVQTVEELDVKKYGIIITKGHRKGVLLPDLEGVSTVEQQIAIAASKAGIDELEGSTVYRFTVERHTERELKL